MNVLREKEVKPLIKPAPNWVLRIFRDLALYVLLLASLIGLTLAWQIPFGYTLDAANELTLDQPFLHNFSPFENTIPKGNQGNWFRWSKGDGVIEFKGIGKRDYKIQLTVYAAINPNLSYVLYANKLKIAEGSLEKNLKSYVFDIPKDAIDVINGDLRLNFQMQSFVPQQLGLGSDSRELGYAFFSAKLDPLDNGFIAPPLNQLGYLLAIILLTYLILAFAGFPAWQTAFGASLSLLLLMLIVATPARIWLTIYTDQLVLAFGWALAMSLLAALPLRKVWQTSYEQRWILSVFGLTLALRLVGLFHPQTQASPTNITDLGFHLHRYGDFWDNHLWWTTIESGEWGNRSTYYPLTTYFLMGWFEYLIPDRRLLSLLWLATLESSRILLVYYLVRRTIADSRAAIFAGLFMAVLPINMLSVAWGQIANLTGEWLILVALCLIVTQRLASPIYFVILTTTLVGSFIVHPGEVLLSGIVFGLIAIFLGWSNPAQAKFLWLSYFLAIGLAFAVYHWVTIQAMLPQALESLQSRLNGGSVSKNVEQTGFRISGQVKDPRLGFNLQYADSVSQMLVGGLKGFWREAQVYYNVIPLLLFLPGLWELRRKDKNLFWCGVAWLITFSLFAVVGLLLNLYVRYSLFLLPFVAIGAGLFLGQLWQRSGRHWATITLTIALFVWLAVSTLTLFLDRMIYFGRGA